MPSHIDEFGTAITATLRVADGTRCSTAFDLTGCTVTFLFRRPDGEVVEEAATIKGSPKKGIAEFIVPDGFLDLVGGWEWQPHIVHADGEWWGNVESFVVDDHLVPDA